MELLPEKATSPLDPTKSYVTTNPLLSSPKRVYVSRDPMAEIARRACEVWFRTEGKPMERYNEVMRVLKSRYGLIASGEEIKKLLASSRARQYKQYLRKRMRLLALRSMTKRLPEVVEDYHWSRETAREQGDYKEVRMAAIDHLDRLGVTLKREVPAQAVQVVVLKGRNFDLSDIDKPTPLIETAEIVQEPDAG